MSFKDVVEQDMDIFFNSDEFSEIHEYEGNDIPVIVDEDKLIELKLRENNHTDGIFQAEKLLYLKEADIAEQFEGKRVTFDGSIYSINSVEHENGMYTVILGGYQS